MASPALERAAAGPGPGGSGGAEETVDFAAGRKRQPPLSAQSAFSFIPTSREGPPELSYFNRKAKEMFPLMMPYLKDKRVTTNIFTEVTDSMQRVVALTLLRRKWQDLLLFCHLQSMGSA
ncbi:cilia- and flagella-associated protein 90 isoform 2-T2 [Amazona ochrocephala]